MNQVNLRGRLTANPDIRNFVQKDGSTGTIAAFTLAVPDRNSKRDESGNFQADFIRCSSFGRNAEVIESFAVKGTELLVSGKLTSSSYEKGNVTVFTTEVTISNFEFVSGTKTKEAKESSKEPDTTSEPKKKWVTFSSPYSLQ